MKQFHSFRLDTVNHCLRRGEQRVSLTPKAFDVLRYLIEHADRLVTQDELLEALWPETYVNPEGIRKYIWRTLPLISLLTVMQSAIQRSTGCPPCRTLP